MEILPQETIDLSIHKHLLRQVFMNEKYVNLANTIIQRGINFDAIDDEIIFDYFNKINSGTDTIIKLLEKFSPNKLTQILYFQFSITNDVSGLLPILLMDKFSKIVDISYSGPSTNNGKTLFELMNKTASSELILEYIDKYKPDLSMHKQLLHIICEYSSNTRLIQAAILHGAPFTNLSFHDLSKLFEIPELKQLLIQSIEAWSKVKITSWVFDELENYRFKGKYSIEFLKLFKSSIDFNYQRGNHTILELCFGRSIFSRKDADEIALIFANDIIDISRHKDLISLVTLGSMNANLLNLIIKNSVNLQDTNIFDITEMCRSNDGITAINVLLDKLKPESLAELLRATIRDLPKNFRRTIPYLPHYSSLFNIFQMGSQRKLSMSERYEDDRQDYNNHNVVQSVSIIARKLAEKHLITSRDMNTLNNYIDAKDCISLLSSWSTKELQDWFTKYESEFNNELKTYISTQLKSDNKLGDSSSANSYNQYPPNLLQSATPIVDASHSDPSPAERAGLLV